MTGEISRLLFSCLFPASEIAKVHPPALCLPARDGLITNPTTANLALGMIVILEREGSRLVLFTSGIARYPAASEEFDISVEINPRLSII